ncbi:hypothetical protein [Paenibacillus tyrfis]|uniref:Uncharacterized protein n=1 Tax=Paenibacillus tyrfis TaxID=1501230 RepID=A0A081P4G5_9BACL|nr:hypothetical protein [Paenibacillus tyrfis]KEQ25588.1 hypothetical protein ET33_02385 [Paenibacillus tyrfis]
MANPKTPNLQLNKVDRSSPSTTYFDTKSLIDENMELIDANVALKKDVNAVREDHTKPLVIEVRTSDPVNPEIGRMWILVDKTLIGK